MAESRYEAECKLQTWNDVHVEQLRKLEQERDSLKAQMAGAVVCGRCDGNGSLEGDHKSEMVDCEPNLWPCPRDHYERLACPARKAGIVWPQEVKGG